MPDNLSGMVSCFRVCPIVPNGFARGFRACPKASAEWFAAFVRAHQLYTAAVLLNFIGKPT